VQIVGGRPENAPWIFHINRDATSRATSTQSFGYLVAAIVVFTGLAIYSLSPHVKARKRWVAGLVLGPPLAVGIGWYGWHQFTERRALQLIRTDQITVDNIQIFDTRIDNFSARVTNHSKYLLTELWLEAIVREGDLVIEREDLTFWFIKVPAGEARDVGQSVLSPYLSDRMRQTLFKGGKRTAGLTIDFRVTRVRGAD
jgi:hypothetical protein